MTRKGFYEWSGIMFGVRYRFFYMKGVGGYALPPGKKAWFEIDGINYKDWRKLP